MTSTADAGGVSPREEVTLSVADEAELGPLARRLVAALPRPGFVALHGDLAAGKTTFAKAFAAAAGIDPAEVLSPTFGVVHEHAGPTGRLLHADMYRLSGPADLHELGWDEALARATWALVEWPVRIEAALPGDRLDVTITVVSPTARELRFTGRGPAHGPVPGLLGK